MSVDQRCDEESLQHIHALLEKHDWSEVCKMVQQVAIHRSVSTTSASRTSVFSGNSTDSRFSALSTDYAPSVLSSTSSFSRPQWDPSIHGPGLNPTRPAPLSVSSPNSQSPSPMDTFFKHLPCPTDSDSRSIASSATRQSGTSTNGGRWFCTFCPTHTSFGAKSDWKKHETRLHETGEDWPCPIRNCFQIFDRQADYLKHCQRHHPDIPPPTDIKIRLLPRLIYGCGFDGCKAVLNGWTERCNHVADLHMKKEGLKHSDWKYSNVIHNLLRQDITRSAWKELFSALTTKQPRCQITWKPENTRILKQKLECGDMRPSIDVVVHTALSLREGRPFNDAVELDPSFTTPSQDSIRNFHNLPQNQLNHILKGNLTTPFPRMRSNTLTASIHRPSNSNTTNFAEPHPGTLVQFDPRPYTEGSMTDANGRRISYMEIDEADPDMSPEPDPQIPPGLDLDPSQIDPTMTPKPISFCYSESIDASSMMDGSQYQRRSSKGHMLPKSLRHFTSRLSPKQTSPHASQQEGGSEFSVPRSYSGHA